MMTIKVILSIALLLVLVFVAASYWVSRPAFDQYRGSYQPQIADPALALTFARTKEGLIWVTSHQDDALSGINLSRQLGPEKTANLLDFVNGLDDLALPDVADTIESFPLADLINPLAYHYPYIAAGTNFKEHAEEVYSDDPPFLFPKLARASGWQDPVPYTPRLDFEAELAMFPLSDITDPDVLPNFGLVLGNDFTDRLTLVKDLSLRKPLGETGFAAGKGCRGCMPTGYLVVIPRSPEFYLGIELSLYVNDALRQQFRMIDMILRIEDIIREAFAAKNITYDNKGNAEVLMPTGTIPRGTLILTGTAAGVIFKPLNIWNPSFYLQPGDIVRTEATYLGHLNNPITATTEQTNADSL